MKAFKNTSKYSYSRFWGWFFFLIRYPLIYALNQQRNLPIYLGNDSEWSRGTKKAFKIKFKMVQKRSLNSISLMLKIIYYLERQALYDNFFLYPVVIESSLIYVGAWSTLSNIFFWWTKITVSLVGRNSDLHHLLALFGCRRSLDNLLVSGQAVGSSACLVEGGRLNARAHVLHNLASCFSFKMRVCWKIEIAKTKKSKRN